MLEVIPCRNCGASSIPIGQVRASIRLAVTDPPCPACRHGMRREQEIFFCSSLCLLVWVRGTEGLADATDALRRGGKSREGP